MKSRSHEFFLIPLLLLAACSTTPTGRRQVTLMPTGQMEQMGDQSFAQMKSKEKVSKDPKLNAKIKCISGRIIKAMDKEDDISSWDVKVFEDEMVNAFALPGKNIGIYTGLISTAQNNAQIASVIGHEVGHVLAQHGNERVSQNLIIQGGLIAADIALDTGSSTKDALIMASLGLTAQLGVLLPFSRKHESEADQIGLDLMAKAGFDPKEAVKFWVAMSESAGSTPPEWLSTHPANKTRIRNLEDLMPEAEKVYRKNTDKYPPCP